MTLVRTLQSTAAILGLAMLAWTTPVSFDWSPEKGLFASLDRAQGRAGRPATPRSAAGVARRQGVRGR